MGRKGQQLSAIVGAGLIALTYPILSVFSVEGRVLGIPTLYAYLFLVWAVLVALMAVVVEWRR